MAPPRIDRLFDHEVRVWRPVPSTANRIGAEERTYSLVDTVGAALNRDVDPGQNTGVGMVPVGRRRLYMRADVDVLARDVLHLIDGPDAGETWEVDQTPTRPRGHHTQVDAIAWVGTLPEVVES